MTEIIQPVGQHGGLPPAEPIASTTASEGLTEEILSNRRLAVRRFLRNRFAVTALAIFSIIAIMVILAPVIAPFDYRAQNTSNAFSGPSWDHFFGTDSLGRDVFSRILYGGRVSVFVGIATAIISAAVGLLFGVTAGYFRGWVDAVLMRFTDTMLALPAVIVAIVSARIFGASVRNVVLLLAFLSWMPLARIARGQVLALKEREFVEAARALGASDGRIVRKHILPNLVGIIMVNITLVTAAAILLEATLSFLGAGITEPTPSWGNMVFREKGQTLINPHLIIFPGAAIVTTVLCISFIGDGLRDAFDPTQRKTG